jgi:redox-sensitive bicupin YhaK (pirin superfamily)
MVSPGDLGELMKPFVFLDHVHGRVAPGTGFGWHPHSGIATLTYSLDSDVAYEDTSGQEGVVEATGLEWMRAGSGTWHRGSVRPRVPVITAFQLWLALPPGVEDGPPEGLYVAPAEVPQVGPVRVLLGTYAERSNPIPTPSPVSYLDVVLAPGGAWTYEPPPGHAVAWLFVYQGSAQVSGSRVADELVVFEEGRGAFSVECPRGGTEPARLLVGSAAKHEHALVLGTYSVHTNAVSLARGEARIVAVGDELRRARRR